MHLQALYEVDPLRDQRWMSVVHRHPKATIFHTRPWLEALRRSYQYEPVVFTDAAPGEPLVNGVLFCRVKSWITGRRLVSLPFSDHCEPLIESPLVLSAIMESLKQRVKHEGRYIELRPFGALPSVSGYAPVSEFTSHSVDLRPSLDQIFATFHKSHTQRAIRRAERLGVTCETGRSDDLLQLFYGLHARTRRRHGIPIQPLCWFGNLLECFGETATIYLARYQDRPIAAILVVDHESTRVYKYGCSDTAYNRYGGTLSLMWRAIQDAKHSGRTEFDLGRSDNDDPGLIAFKDHLGGRRSTLTYYRCTGPSLDLRRTPAADGAIASLVPRTIKARMGGSLYRHFG
jgi:GNAT acetyltransferase-like protein